MQTRNYALVTAGYWAFTLTDGALRMLVLLYFNELGYSPVSLAFLFLALRVHGDPHEPARRMGRLTDRLEQDPHRRPRVCRSSRSVALTFQQPSWPKRDLGRIRDGGTGTLRRRQGPDEDEFEECGEVRRRRRRRRAVQARGDPHRFEECAQGRRLLPRRGAARRGRLRHGAVDHGRRHRRSCSPWSRPC